MQPSPPRRRSSARTRIRVVMPAASGHFSWTKATVRRSCGPPKARASLADRRSSVGPWLVHPGNTLGLPSRASSSWGSPASGRPRFAEGAQGKFLPTAIALGGALAERLAGEHRDPASVRPAQFAGDLPQTIPSQAAWDERRLLLGRGQDTWGAAPLPCRGGAWGRPTLLIHSKRLSANRLRRFTIRALPAPGEGHPSVRPRSHPGGAACAAVPEDFASKRARRRRWNVDLHDGSSP